jgi:hypothetical protein
VQLELVGPRGEGEVVEADPVRLGRVAPPEALVEDGIRLEGVDLGVGEEEPHRVDRLAPVRADVDDQRGPPQAAQEQGQGAEVALERVAERVPQQPLRVELEVDEPGKERLPRPHGPLRLPG